MQKKNHKLVALYRDFIDVNNNIYFILVAFNLKYWM